MGDLCTNPVSFLKEDYSWMLIVYFCCESCMLFCLPALTRVIFQLSCLLGWSGSWEGAIWAEGHLTPSMWTATILPLCLDLAHWVQSFTLNWRNTFFLRISLLSVVYELPSSKHFFDMWLYLVSASPKTYEWRILVLHRQQLTDHCPFLKYFKIWLFSVNCLSLLLWRFLCLKPSNLLARGSCIIVFFKTLFIVMSVLPCSSF